MILCLTALLLSGCAGQRAIQPADDVVQVVTSEFQGEYTAALGMMRERRYDQAGIKLDDITRSYPGLAGPYINLGIAYHHLGRVREAESALVAATGLNPRSAIAHNLLGVIYRAEGRFEDARRAYLQALEIDPEYADAHLNLGILYDLYLLRPEPALAHYRRYRAIRPSDAARVDPWIADLVRTHGFPREENGS